jgi:hypothetical protein
VREVSNNCGHDLGLPEIIIKLIFSIKIISKTYLIHI